jgi:GT2 family glycosyltransferase
MCKPDTLKKLLAHNVDMVSALICNGHMVAKDFNCDPYIFTNIMRKNKDDETKYIHVSVEEYNNSNINNDSNSLIEVDLTGAIALMSKRLCKSGAKYDFNNFGEDANFCLEVQKKGFRIYSDVRIRLPHIMSQEYLDKYLTGEFVF